MIEPILRAAAILMLIVTIVGAGRLIYWLGAVWLPSFEIVPLSVQAFDVMHGEKAGKEEGKHLATLFVKEIRRIQSIMAADLSNLRDVDQVRFESLVPKSLNFEPDVSVKVDIQVKAFEMDVIGILESFYKFFDRSDRLQTTMWVNERIKLFAALKTENKLHSIGPWWLEKQVDEQAAVESFARLFAFDLYKTEVRGLDGLDAISFTTFVTGLDKYHAYVRTRHSDISASTAVLNSAGDTFQNLVNEGKASGIVYSYLGSVRSIQSQADAAIEAYTRALELNPSDRFAELARNKVRIAKALQPVPAAAAPPNLALEKLKEQRLPGYDSASLPPSLRDITIAVIATGISPDLVKVLGPRLLDSINLVSSESTDDHFGHGTAVTALAAALAPSAKFISIKALSDTGAGDMQSIARAIKGATQRHANVILLPLGSSDPSPPIVEAVTEALKAGVLVIAAAGNEGAHEPGFPARQDGVLPIGAIDQSEKKADFSNTGSHVLYAPGVNILVFAESGLVTQSGTSFSATVASAIAAVVWAAKPELSSDQILQLLNSSSIDLGPIDSTRPELGNIRRLDVKKAVSDYVDGSVRPTDISGSRN